MYRRLLLAISLFFISQYSLAQTTPNDSIEIVIEKRIEAVYDDLYYSDLTGALQDFHAVSKVAVAHQLWHKQLEIVLNMAWCADHHNNLDTLGFYLKEAEIIFKHRNVEIQKLDTEGESIINMFYTTGMYYYALNDFEKAIAEFKKIIDYDKSRNRASPVDSLSVSNAFTYIGDSYYILNNLAEAKTYHELAIQWLPKVSNSYGDRMSYEYYFALNQSHLGKCNYALAKQGPNHSLYSLALSNFRTAIQAFSINHKSDLYPIAVNFNRISNIFFDLEKYDSALLYLQKSLTLLQPSDVLAIDTYIKMGDIFLKKKNWTQTMQHYDKALDIVNLYVEGKHYRKTVIAYKKGEVYYQQQDFLSALKNCQHAIENVVDGFTSHDIYSHPDVVETLSEKELLQVLGLKGETFLGLYVKEGKDLKNLEAALKNYQLAIDLLDRMRNKFQSAEYKQFIVSSSNALYENAIEAAYLAFQHTADPAYMDQAYYFAEKNKSRILLEAVKSSFATQFSSIPEEILNDEKEIQGKISSLNNELMESRNAGEEKKISNLRSQLLEWNLKSEQLSQLIKDKYPAFYNLKYDAQVANIAEIRNHLSAKTLVLEYFYGESAIYVFGIHQNKISFIKYTKDGKALEDKLEQILSKVKSPPGIHDKTERFEGFVQQASFLYEALIEPSLKAWEGQAIDEILIIPDGPLGYLPFEVLLKEKSQNIARTNYNKLDYLLYHYTIRYGFSGTLSVYEQVKTSLESKFTYIGFAPSYIPGTNTLYGPLRPLRNNQPEIQEVSDLFGGLAFIGKDASKMAFKDFAGQSKILHLSMHAHANDHNPLSSGLIFSNEIPGTAASSDAGENIFLYLHELYNMSLGADLAILSACETGTGQLARGEGIISLGRAFKFAGCPNIVMSLWNANDHSTAGIMLQFHKYLKNSLNKDEALRMAKLDYLAEADNNLSHPYYWSTFILVGDNKPIMERQAVWSLTKLSSLFIILATVVFIGMILLTISYLRRKRIVNE